MVAGSGFELFAVAVASMPFDLYMTCSPCGPTGLVTCGRGCSWHRCNNRGGGMGAGQGAKDACAHTTRTSRSRLFAIPRLPPHAP